jgi:hypothetical protein
MMSRNLYLYWYDDGSELRAINVRQEKTDERLPDVVCQTGTKPFHGDRTEIINVLKLENIHVSNRKVNYRQHRGST